MENRLAIWLKYPDEDGLVRLDDRINVVSDTLWKNYTRRLVPSLEELLEKIKIAESGLDDFQIELIKLLVCMGQQIDLRDRFLFKEISRPLLGSNSLVFSVGEA